MTEERDDAVDLVEAARPKTDDPGAALIRARLKERLLGVAAQAPQLGRFTLLDHLGSGAMGAVYAAYDPVLDRKVALKVLHDQGGLLEEARLLARLSHPNVVAVYDAEQSDDAVYIAMELVAGASLTAWLAEKPRTAEEIIEVMVEAGRGLAAAHRAGVVHSDFKPDNVLVSQERTCVSDFGVARLEEAGGGGGGTPRYMAPEQKRDGSASPKSDQFAYGRTLAEVLPEGPAHVRRVIERATQADPQARYPDMEALLADLQPPDRTRRRFGIAALLGIVVIAGAFFWAGQKDPCSGADGLTAEVWNTSRRTRLERHLAAREPDYGRTAAERVTSGFDRFRAEWSQLHREVCEATRVHHTQSDSAHDARMTCLDRQLREMDAIASALLDTEDRPGIARGVRVALSLRPNLEVCEARALDPPSPHATASQTRYRMGDYRGALRAARAAVQVAPHDPDALVALARAEGRTGSATVAETRLQAALVEAARQARDQLAADIWQQLLRSRLFGGRYDEVLAMETFARAAATRAGLAPASIDGIVGEALIALGRYQDGVLRIERALPEARSVERRAIMTTNLGSGLLELGKIQDADEAFADALARMTSHLGEGHPALGFYMEKLARSRRGMGRHEEALDLARRAMSLRVRAYGPKDRAVATTRLNIARTLMAQAKWSEAESQLKQALEIRRHIYGPEHPSLAPLLDELAQCKAARKEWKSALDFLEAAIVVMQKTAPEHPNLESLSRRAADARSRLRR